MARLKPMSLAALRSVYGVGERKAQDLGERFVREIRGDRKFGSSEDRKFGGSELP
jgi:HRDC domain